MRLSARIIWLILWTVCEAEVQHCDFPQIKNGELYNEERYKPYFPAEIGSEYYYHCNQGFVTPSRAYWENIRCTVQGWKPAVSCRRLCRIHYIENGKVLQQRKDYIQDQSVRVQCYSGYSLLNGQDTVTCTENGWSPQPRCIRVNSTEKCGRPPPIENGDITSFPLQAYTPSSSVEYQCQSYYQLEGNSKITCRNGEWSEPPKCLLKSPCSQPPEIDHGSIILPRSSEGRRDTAEPRSYEHGTTLSYVCDDGFRMTEEHGVTCNMGKWSAPPRCVDKSCGDPPHVENAAIVTWPMATYPSIKRVRYECNKPFEILGEVEVICHNGIWTEPPKCTDSTGKCGRPPPIENGDITSFPLQAYAPSSSVKYQCQSYYRLAGNSKITCRNGKWSEPPKCLRPCVISEEIMERHNITLKWISHQKLYSTSGDLVEFSCKYRYKEATKSPPFRTRCIDGHINYPSCTKKVLGLVAE